MKTRVVRVGNSYRIRLPRALLQKAGLGSEVAVRAKLRRIIIAKTIRPRMGWAEAARRMRAQKGDRLLNKMT